MLEGQLPWKRPQDPSRFPCAALALLRPPWPPRWLQLLQRRTLPEASFPPLPALSLHKWPLLHRREPALEQALFSSRKPEYHQAITIATHDGIIHEILCRVSSPEKEC